MASDGTEPRMTLKTWLVPMALCFGVAVASGLAVHWMCRKMKWVK
jgi:hypothetical protein